MITGPVGHPPPGKWVTRQPDKWVIRQPRKCVPAARVIASPVRGVTWLPRIRPWVSRSSASLICTPC